MNDETYITLQDRIIPKQGMKNLFQEEMGPVKVEIDDESKSTLI